MIQHSFNFQESKKEVVGLALHYHKATNLSTCYKYGKIAEIVLCLAMAAVFGYGYTHIRDDRHIHCSIYGVSYECDGPPTKFYTGILIATFAILPIYGFLAIYAVFWTWEHPIVAPLYDAIARYVHETVENNKEASFSGLKQYFFGNPDVRMLLNLLTESKGLASALRVLALFDENFYEDLKVPDIYFPNLPPKIEKRVCSKNVVSISKDNVELLQEEDRYDLDVRFNHAPANKTLFKRFAKMSFYYTIEIAPQTENTSIIALKNVNNLKNFERQNSMKLMKEDDVAENVLEDLDPTKEYTVTVKTIANGVPLAFRTETFGPITKKS